MRPNDAVELWLIDALANPNMESKQKQEGVSRVGDAAFDLSLTNMLATILPNEI